VTRVDGHPVACGESSTWRQVALPVPSLPASFSLNDCCKVLDVEYRLDVSYNHICSLYSMSCHMGAKSRLSRRASSRVNKCACAIACDFCKSACAGVDERMRCLNAGEVDMSQNFLQKRTYAKSLKYARDWTCNIKIVTFLSFFFHNCVITPEKMICLFNLCKGKIQN
jgi:hypothetical protein